MNKISLLCFLLVAPAILCGCVGQTRQVILAGAPVTGAIPTERDIAAASEIANLVAVENHLTLQTHHEVTNLVAFYVGHSNWPRHEPTVFVAVRLNAAEGTLTVTTSDDPPNAHVALMSHIHKSFYKAFVARFGKSRVRQRTTTEYVPAWFR